MSAWPLREWPSGENYPFFDGGSGGDDEEVGKDQTCPALMVAAVLLMKMMVISLTRNSNPTI